jgi:hypothetical protein
VFIISGTKMNFHFYETELKMVQDLLLLSDAEWRHILDTAAEAGELLYLSSKKSDQEAKVKPNSDQVSMY